MPIIVKPGYEAAIRTRLGIKAVDLPDEDINQRMIMDLAEALVIKRVPDHALITDDIEKLHLENAVIAQICFLLCPGMARRLNIHVQTIDVTWKKDKIDWAEMAQVFATEFENALSNITSVTVNTGYDSTLLAIIKGPSAGTGGG